MQEWTVLRLGELTDYLESTAMTSRPLYCPHFGQARCGILRSWQLGHSESDWPVKWSCARRVEVRRF